MKKINFAVDASAMSASRRNALMRLLVGFSLCTIGLPVYADDMTGSYLGMQSNNATTAFSSLEFANGFKTVTEMHDSILSATDTKQSPWDRSSLTGDIRLAQIAPPAVQQPAAAGTPPSNAPTVPSAPGGVAGSAPEPGTDNECDKIAGQKPPYSSSAAVHEVNETDWLRGVEVCTAEIQAHPNEIRFVYQLGRAQDHLKNYIEALRDYKVAVSGGSVDAMVDLGAMYFRGHGVIQNYTTAFDYFSKAMAAGSSRGMADLAAMYGDGIGVPRDNAKSLDFAEKAIEAGNPFGLKIVADHYFNGAGVPRDFVMAAQYLQQAADIGDGLSMKFLANMYESGYLGPPNLQKAAELRLRAQQVDPESHDPLPAHLPMVKRGGTATAQVRQTTHVRRYVVYHSSYNPAWQAAPGDTRCCPNNMLVCPLGRHFCGH